MPIQRHYKKVIIFIVALIKTSMMDLFRDVLPEILIFQILNFVLDFNQ